MTATETRPYLSGNYAPIPTEIDAGPLACAAGAIPHDLAGLFVRNSSNPRFPVKGRYHWFDGDGMMHGVHFEDGRATYRNRWVRTDAFVAEEKAGEPLWGGVTERPDFTNPRGPFKDTSNTDLVYHAGRLMSLWWLGGAAYVLRCPSLETAGVETWGGKVKTLSAHPKVDPVTGEMMFFDYKPFPPYLVYGVVSAAGELSHFTTIDLPGPRLQHDMAITERYSILLDMSMMWDPKLLAQGRTKVAFFRDRPSRFGVLPRHGDGREIRWLEASPFYMYHTINAWEEGETIVVVGCKIDDPLAGDPANPKEPGPGRRPSASSGSSPSSAAGASISAPASVREEVLDDTLAEFPRMDNRILGRRSRYSYHGRMAATETMLFDGVVKYDADSGRSWTRRYPEGWFGGETVFAPRVGSRGEDDGYLLTFVAEEATGTSELWVMDAGQPEAEPEARITIPQRVPTGYHTWWVGADDLANQREMA